MSKDTLASRPIELTLRGQKLVLVTLTRKITPSGPRIARHVKVGTWMTRGIADSVALRLSGEEEVSHALKLLLGRVSL